MTKNSSFISKYFENGKTRKNSQMCAVSIRKGWSCLWESYQGLIQNHSDWKDMHSQIFRKLWASPKNHSSERYRKIVLLFQKYFKYATCNHTCADLVNIVDSLYPQKRSKKSDILSFECSPLFDDNQCRECQSKAQTCKSETWSDFSKNWSDNDRAIKFVWKIMCSNLFFFIPLQTKNDETQKLFAFL